MRIVVGGVDLSASSKRTSGVCLVVNGVLSLCDKKYDDLEIIDSLYTFGKPRVVALDAPLSLVDSGFRKVEQLMIKDGFKLLPLGMKGMRQLAERGIRLKKLLEKDGVTVIETHPSSAFNSAGCKERKHGVTECISKYVKLEHEIKFESKDMEDAAIAACVAWMYINNKTVVYESSGESIHLLPRLNTKT
jgi:predicted nuclease with RNAse H fold